MEGSAGDSTDQDAIRPVSSLRSLFERKTTTESGPGTPTSLNPSIALARPDPARDEFRTVTRASLDIPRRPSPWSNDPAVSSPQGHSMHSPAMPRPQQSGPRNLQRPLSTTSLTGARSPPLVTIEAPKSPPRQRAVASFQLPSYSAPPRPLTPSSIDRQSPRFAPPPKRPGFMTTADLQITAETQEIEHPKPLDERPPTHNSSRGAPPPVNRADKPRIPAKPTQISVRPNLQPTEPPSDERVSPFSTPPSSDESTGAGSSINNASLESRGPDTSITSHKSSSQSSHKHNDLRHSRQQSFDSGRPARKRTPDARQLGFTLTTAMSSPVIEDRPGLPPRRGQGRSVGLVQHNDHSFAPQKAPNRDIIDKESIRTGVEQSHSAFVAKPQFQPPPKRALISNASIRSASHGAGVSQDLSNPSRVGLPFNDKSSHDESYDTASQAFPANDYPDASNTNRRPPYCKRGAHELGTGYDTRIADVCGQFVATTGHVTRVWDVISGENILTLGTLEKDLRIASMAFKPAAKASDEGSCLWLGTNYGDLQEIDILTQSIVKVKGGVHERREILRILRHQSSMWTLDDGGKLCVWLGYENGLPNLHTDPLLKRVPKGHTASIVIQDMLWLAVGKDIWIFRPTAGENTDFSVLERPLTQSGAGAITSAAVISGQLDRVYFGHADGKVTIYSTQKFTCLATISVSIYKINALAGAGFHLWAGFSTGMMYVYDTRTQPWTVRKEWLAHEQPVVNISVDRGSLWKDGVLRVISLGMDNIIRFWDGTLEDDWLENDVQDRDIEYCTFREITALVVTWNAGAATPTHLRHDENHSSFFQTIIAAKGPPDLLIFGFQELVDLEDKKLTASMLLYTSVRTQLTVTESLFKGSKKKDPQEPEHMSHQYRAWRDYLVHCIEDTMPSNEPYFLLHTASMVGLFSCVFIRGSQHDRVRDVNAAEIKRGMGGLHGNKGALVLRFILDDTSLCFANCHLAAGQTQTANRNNDITAILESTVLFPDQRSSDTTDTFVGGGDGSMILDNEICILNGDLNYRIDTMGRDTVVKAVNTNNFARLLERDQLLVSRRRNPLFKVRAFKELPITFAPTYKYDVGTDRYDTSEKRRAPAWCDRIMFRGTGKVKQIEYRRHELRVSDHRPVSGRFTMRIKSIDAEKRARLGNESRQRFQKAKEKLATEAKIEYLRDVLGVPPAEARRLI